jgi:hypothetical protein
MEVTAAQLEAWNSFRERRLKTAKDDDDPWRLAGHRTETQLAAINDGWSIGLCWDVGRFEVIDGPMQGQSVAQSDSVTLEVAPGALVRMKVKLKKPAKGAKGGHPKRTASWVEPLEG